MKGQRRMRKDEEGWGRTRCNSGCKEWQGWRLALPSCKSLQPAPGQLMIMMMVAMKAMMAWYSISMTHVTNPIPLIDQDKLTSPVWAEQAAWQGRCPAHAPLSIFPPQQRLDLLHIRACTAHNPAHNYRCLCHQGCQSWVITINDCFPQFV